MNITWLYLFIIVLFFCLWMIWKISSRNATAKNESKRSAQKQPIEINVEKRYDEIRATYNANHPVSRDAERLYKDLKAGKITDHRYHMQMDILLKKRKM